MNILVLGSTGMVGHFLVEDFSREKNWNVVGTQARDPQAPRYFRIEEGVESLERLGSSFDYVINCIVVTPWHIDPLESGSVHRAVETNASFPHELAEYTGTHNMRLIHISTDGVFSGHASTPYSEDAPADALDVYGRTKWLGEVHAPHVLTIRTSLVGRSPFKREGLLEWFLSQSDGSTIPGFTNHVWNGVTTVQFAQFCKSLISNDHFLALRSHCSLFHFAPNQAVTKCQLLEMFKATFKKDVTVNPVEDSRGSVHRILTSKYDILKTFMPHDQPMVKAIASLST